MRKEVHEAMKTSKTGDSSSMPKVSLTDMEDAVRKSGYLLERRVATFLRKEAYKAVANRGFMDQETTKSREYDVYAYKGIEVCGTGSCGLYPTLVCECKNNTQPIVFFIQKETFEPLIDEVRVSGIPSKIWKRNKYISVQEFTNVATVHHYCIPEAPVATQYCTFETKKNTSNWMASHTDELHDTFRTLTKALEQEIDDDYRNMAQWFIPEEIAKEFVDLSVYYPVVVFQGDIYAASIGNKDLTEEEGLELKPCDHIQYNPEFFSFYDNEVISYHMDIVSEKYLPSYLKIIDREMHAIKQIMEQEKSSVTDSINRIVAECIGLKDKPRTYRKHLEYEF